jgi:hypothetical protein
MMRAFSLTRSQALELLAKMSPIEREILWHLKASAMGLKRRSPHPHKYYQ